MNILKLQIKDPRFAMLFMALFAICSGGIVTYISSVLTTLEKRFEFNSMEMGALMGANDIGYLTAVIFVAYFGSKKNRQPILLFCSGIGLWLSCMIYSLPYFIYGSKYNAESLLNINASSNKDLCRNITSNLSTNIVGYEINSQEKSVTMLILMIAGVLIGISSTPFWSLGISFLDDMAGPTKSGIYIGILYGTRTFAPILGFLLGSFVLKYHESLQIKVSHYLPGQKDLKWIGAWWLGWIILGFCVLIPTPFMLFLKAVKKVNEVDDKAQKIEFIEVNQSGEKGFLETKTEANGETNIPTLQSSSKAKNFVRDLQNLFGIIKESIQNKIFTSLVIGMICEIISFIWMLTFFTKFLEFHYRVPVSLASIMSGMCLSGSSMVSSLTSGITSRLYKTNIRNMNGYHAIVNSVSALLFPILFIFTCSSIKIVGLDPESKNSMCSGHCNCQIKKLEPVCYNFTTYFSPCVAGCSKQINETFYSNCGCGNSYYASKGFCGEMCLSVYGFLVGFFFIRIVGSIASVQFTQILMRLTNPKFKAVNLSLIGFIFGICGLSLPPIVGILLDTACVHRNTNKFGGKSHCLIYDNDKMRHLLLGVTFALQIPACLFYIYSWLKTPADYIYQGNKDKSTVNTEVPT